MIHESQMLSKNIVMIYYEGHLNSFVMNVDHHRSDRPTVHCPNVVTGATSKNLSWQVDVQVQPKSTPNLHCAAASALTHLQLDYFPFCHG